MSKCGDAPYLIYITQLLKLELLSLPIVAIIGAPMWANLLSSIVLRAIRGVMMNQCDARSHLCLSFLARSRVLVVDTGGLVFDDDTEFYH